MNRTIVAIHQPNFFPWLGYFDKINRCDVFILLDNVQFPKTGGTWTNRVKIAANGSPAWITLPVARNYSGTRLISEMQINESTCWRKKLLKTLQTNYGKAPYFKQALPILEPLIMNQTESVADYNIHAITRLCSELGFDTKKLVRGSELQANGSATDLLIEMTKSVGGTAYMCGGGSGGYQEDEKFHQEGLELSYQNFKHPTYEQTGTSAFIPGLSILDALFNLGFERLARLIQRQP